MENHNEITLFQLRMFIIRYGAKYMESMEGDLFVDCTIVGKMHKGDTLYWMVSGLHSHIYSGNELRDRGMDSAKSLWGDRFNYRITCTKDKDEMQFNMERVGSLKLILTLDN